MLRRLLAPRVQAHAHCDLPSGVYDPAQARIEAQSVKGCMEKHNASDDPEFRQRAITIKEARSNLVKEHLWVLWSHESSEDRAGRAGWLTRAELGPDGAPGVPQRCLALPQGKPEGVAVWGDQLVIVFDNDRASKDPKDPGRFRLLPNQDFGLVIAKPACDLGPAF